MDGTGGEGARYRAFISYSHVDQAFGRRLHRRLERYRLPGRLVGRAGARGPVPRRIAPVFRDREEFSAAGDLTAEVRAALAASGALVVVCSPAAAASPWVAREIELFRELHPDRPVLAAIAHGEPAEAFPRPLTRAGGAALEPLAADFRSHADGPRLGLLKLVAGIAGLGLDELVRRDAQRRMWAVTAVTAGAVALALIMSGLTAAALLAQREAERQRAEAEALVEFMLTDLRDRLKGVGRLDVLASVNARTLGYYADQDIAALPAESQARYARILHAMGEDDLTRGDRTAAQLKFEAASDVTRRLLAHKPNDLDRAWDQAQSEHWLAYAAYVAKDRRRAGQHWGAYRAFAARLAAARPQDVRFRRELAYAEGNLCTLAMLAPADPSSAVAHCRVALVEMQSAAKLAPPSDGSIYDDLANRHAWLADAYAANGMYEAALQQRAAEEQLLLARIATSPQDTRLKHKWVVLQWAYAALAVKSGDREGALARLRQGLAAVRSLVALEPANAAWRRQQGRFEAAIRRLSEINQQKDS